MNSSDAGWFLFDSTAWLKSRELQGWYEIAEFLGFPVAVVQRWARSGMPVRRGGRYVYARPEELNTWIAKESPSHAPVLAADLKSSLAAGEAR